MIRKLMARLGWWLLCKSQSSQDPAEWTENVYKTVRTAA